MNETIIAEQTTIQNILIMQNAPFQLSMTQKTQVSLLYYFASLDYLKGLQQRLHALMTSIDPTLELAKLQNRDALLTDRRWGTRNTAAAWANNGWSFLANFELSVTKDIAERAFEVYSITGANFCGRGLDELSLGWMTPDEEAELLRRMEEISLYAMNIDYTMAKSHTAGRWSDFELALSQRAHPQAFVAAPRLRLRPDIRGQSGAVPSRTGVYLPWDDPNGTPQFCWTGAPPGGLQECKTLNDLGNEALLAIGRESLWLDDQRMQVFFQNHAGNPLLNTDPSFKDGLLFPEVANAIIADHAFGSQPCQWIYVEQIHGEVEDWSENLASTPLPNWGQRIEGGSVCLQSGYYFAPAKRGSRRYFAKDETMPNIDGDCGATIWQRDTNQTESG